MEGRSEQGDRRDELERVNAAINAAHEDYLQCALRKKAALSLILKMVDKKALQRHLQGGKH